MMLMTTFRVALSSLGANKLRAGLTLLGIVIGVAAVISLMSIGRGVQQTITSRIQSLGTNLLFVQPGTASRTSGAVRSQGSATTLTLEDAYSLVDPVFAPSVVAVAPQLSTSGQLVFGRQNTSAQILGVTPEYQYVRNSPVGSGGFVAPEHLEERAQVVVLGATLAQTLFGFRDPVGQPVRINGRQFTVIGVLKSKGGTGFGSLDNQAMVPITTAYYRLASQRTTRGAVNVQNISVQAASVDVMDDAVQEIATVLRLRHRITGEDDFTTVSQEETIQTLRDTTNSFVIFLGAIASISLLVGGIGIMNIMLVSVTERTREIGIRKAMGAKRRDILFQFMTEATLLSLGGGILGMLLGLGLSRLVNGRTLVGPLPLQTAFSGDIAIIALVVSAAIGLFFGIYPAMRAARLHPIEALRYE